MQEQQPEPSLPAPAATQPQAERTPQSLAEIFQDLHGSASGGR